MMSEYYRPDRAGDTDATVQWKIDDGVEGHYYVIEFTPEACATPPGSRRRRAYHGDNGHRSVRSNLSGQANPVKLLMTRKLKASGDVLFARKIDVFFDLPTA